MIYFDFVLVERKILLTEAFVLPLVNMSDHFCSLSLLISAPSAESFTSSFRITSYNVCYTKLLRWQ